MCFLCGTDTKKFTLTVLIFEMGNIILTEKDVKKIRELYANKKNNHATIEKLADKFGVSNHTISETIYNIYHYDESYKPPIKRKYKRSSEFNIGSDKFVKREEAENYKFRCPICGMGVYTKDRRSPDYGKPFKSQSDANKCCKDLTSNVRDYRTSKYE